jgi:hypothetical protein
MDELGIGYKAYLWLRRRYVVDILFKRSADHLDDMLDQFKKGRTHTKTAIEVGVMISIKEDWLRSKEELLKQYLI